MKGTESVSGMRVMVKEKMRIIGASGEAIESFWDFRGAKGWDFGVLRFWVVRDSGENGR